MELINSNNNSVHRSWRYDTPYLINFLDSQEASAMQCAAMLSVEDVCDILEMLDAHAITLDHRTEMKLRASLNNALIINGPYLTISQTGRIRRRLKSKKEDKRMSYVRADLVSVLFALIALPLWPQVMLDQLRETDS